MTAASAPYTYYLPPTDFLEAVGPGDSVKVIIQSIPASPKYDSERMWIEVIKREGDQIVGLLDNHPFDMPQLKAGDRVSFQTRDIIDINWNDEALVERGLERANKRSYWERCMVDSVVVNANIAVDYIYREPPDMTEDGDKYPDSGWRIRGNSDAMTQEQYDAEDSQYIALGAVLNADDSWLHLIDAPVGSRFVKDSSTGKFMPVLDD